MAQSREIEKLQRRWQENPLGLTFAPLAEAYRKDGMYEEALELLELGLVQHPNYVPAHIVRARCHLDTGADARAESAFQRVAELDPENVIALKGMAEIAERGARFEEAAERLQALLQFDRNNEDARAQLKRVQALIAMPSPGTIDLEPPPAAAAPSRPEAAAPAGAREAPTPAEEPSEPVEAAAGPMAAAEAPEAVSLEPTEIALEQDLAADLRVEDLETSDAGRPAAPDGAPVPAEAVVAEAADATAELAEAAESPQPVPAAAEAAPPAEPELTEDTAAEDAQPPAVEARVLDRVAAALDVELFHPMELTAGADTEYQPRSDSESLRGGSQEQIAESGERVVPLFAAEPMPPAPPEPAAADDASAVEPADEGADPELVVTETMAEIFLRQGHRELALAVYTQLRQRDPANDAIRLAIEQLEREFQPRGPSLPAFAAALTGGQSVRSFLEAVLTAAPPTETAGDGPALGSVFGDEVASTPERSPEPEGGPTFDEFFADREAEPPPPAPTDPRATAPASASEDIEEFNAWLRGLKR